LKKLAAEVALERLQLKGKNSTNRLGGRAAKAEETLTPATETKGRSGKAFRSQARRSHKEIANLYFPFSFKKFYLKIG
jgi:hypothetical protein